MYEILAKINYKLQKIEEDDNIKNIKLYKRGVYEFELNKRPKCNICGSDLQFIKVGKKLIINKCLNDNCKTNNKELKKGAPIKWKAFLPDFVLEQQHKNHIENNTYNLNFLINKKGFSIDEANEYINKHKELSKIFGRKNKGISIKEKIIKKLGSLEAANKYIRERNYFCKEYWIKKHGYSEDEAIKKIAEIQSKNGLLVKNHRGYSKLMAIENGVKDPDLFMKEKSHFCKEYWIKRGYSEEEALKTVSEIQRKNSNKITPLGRRKASVRCKEFWYKLGYNEEQINAIITRYQTTFSKEICINKYGIEKGLEIFKQRQEKWQLTLHNKSKMHCGYSKISQDLFNELIKHSNNEIYYGSLNREYTIYNKENKHVYAFDYTDLTNKKILEFQGDIYHANPNLFSEYDKPSPWNNLTSKEIWEKDEYKKQVALNNNFDVLQVWESDFRNNKEETIKKCLKFLNYE